MTTQTNTTIRRADQRGTTDLGWLRSHHSFSFGQYQDPDRISFRSLRVLNDDVIQGGTGFSEHGHDNMEIISWVLRGQLAHKDSTGTRGVLNPGDAQVMTAGRGIRHSEMNGSTTDPAHFIQIWIMPDTRDVEPAYDQRTFDPEGRRNQWQPIADGDGRNGALPIHQDATVSIADVDAATSIEFSVLESRFGYIHVATGTVRIEDTTLHAGDAIEISLPTILTITALDDAQLISFDLA